MENDYKKLEQKQVSMSNSPTNNGTSIISPNLPNPVNNGPTSPTNPYGTTQTTAQYWDALQQMQKNSNPYSTNEWDDIYSSALKKQNYEGLLNANTQLAYVQAMANKYMQNDLASQNLDGTGEGTSYAVQQNNNIVNAYQQALQNYQNQQANIDLQQSKVVAEKLQSLVEKISNDPASAYSQLEAYGLGTYNKDTGEFKFNEKFDNLDADVQLDLKNAMSANGYDQTVGKFGMDYDTLMADKSGSRDNDVEWSKEYKYETQQMNQWIAQYGKDANGACFKFSRSDGRGKDSYLMYKNGMYYIIDEATFQKSTKKVRIRGKSSRGYGEWDTPWWKDNSKSGDDFNNYTFDNSAIETDNGKEVIKYQGKTYEVYEDDNGKFVMYGSRRINIKS